MKNRRKFIHRLLAVVPAIAVTPAFGLSKQSKKTIPGKFVHAVYFWLKDTTDISIFMRETADFISEIPEVVAYHVGEPAKTPRDVVDNSYSVSLVVTFKDAAAQDAYQVHPKHVEFVDKNKDKWIRVKIYDSIMG